MQTSTESRTILAGHLLAAVAKGMCHLAYTASTHADHVFCERVQQNEYEEARQHRARKGALCAHSYISAYERIIASLVAWNIVTEHGCAVFRMTIDADDVPVLVAKHSILTDEMFAEAIEAFLNFDAQHGWPANHFSGDLVSEFLNSGLLEVDAGSLNWTPEMLPYFEHVITVPWDADELFRRICRRCTD